MDPQLGFASTEFLRLHVGKNLLTEFESRGQRERYRSLVIDIGIAFVDDFERRTNEV